MDDLPHTKRLLAYCNVLQAFVAGGLKAKDDEAGPPVVECCGAVRVQYTCIHSAVRSACACV
jgi:hypothetical protein